MAPERAKSPPAGPSAVMMITLGRPPRASSPREVSGGGGMELAHEFTVNTPIDRAWAVLTDVERIAACMPGDTPQSVDR